MADPRTGDDFYLRPLPEEEHEELTWTQISWRQIPHALEAHFARVLTDIQAAETAGGLAATDIAAGTITAAPGALDLSGGSTGHVLTKQAGGGLALQAQAGGGDMSAATYDPTGVAADAFARANHTGTQLMATISDAGSLATLSAVGAAQITDGTVGNAEIRDAAALSVVGRSANSTGDVADIAGTASTKNVLRVSGTALGFGNLDTSYITSGVFADARIAESNVTQHQGAIDHDALTNFVAGEHVLHTGVILTAGTGLTGGGDISASRAFNLEDTAVTPGAYTLASVTVDQQGRITAASSGSGTDTAGSRVASVTGALAVDTATHAHAKNVVITSDQASSVFTIENTTAAGTSFLFNVAHDDCTIVIEAGAGSINGGATAYPTNGGWVWVHVQANAGSAPTIVAIGDLVLAPTDVSGVKTYDIDDHAQEFVLSSGAGTQTFDTAVATLIAGYEVIIYNESGGNITIDGLDADHTLSDNGSVHIKKAGSKLIARGTDGVTVLDAA